MAGLPNVPEPTYEYEVARLVAAYKRAVADIQRELERLDLTGISNANARAALAEVSRILTSLNEDSAKWVEENIPQAARDGIARTLVSLGVVETLQEAEAIVKFNRINANMVASAVADTQSDLLAVTQNVDRKVRAAIRQAVGESMRANMAAGINGRRTINRDTLAGMRKALGDSVNTGIIDAAGRRWKPEVYVDMVTRTKLMQTQIDAATNEALARDTQYAVISKHGAADACRFHEGRIIKLTPEAVGPYPTMSELKATGQIWHPNCRHVVSPIRVPEKLSDDTRAFAEKQAAIGDKAIATGKRAPTVDDMSPFEKRPDIAAPRDLSAAGRRLYVRDTVSVRHTDKLYVKPGTYVTGVHVFAKGTQIRDVNRLVHTYPTSDGKFTLPDDWEKVRGRATVVESGGTEREAEIHWYQARQVGEVEIKLKRYFT
jgi:hypothetical protein